ncbi:MAG TPA: DNA primase [Alphaproteobacteria bacterium]|nr:DNA primase [Alphaproteobacteria bacterium]
MANIIKFSKHDLDMIVQRLSLVDFVGKSVQLKRRGNDYWGCCPFHGEKTASFHVREDKKYYHCFGCSAHGNIFEFAKFVRGGTFPEVVEYLADMAGIKLETQNVSPAQQKEYSDSIKALEFATKLYQKRLTETELAKKYLLERGLSEETIAQFKLGFALNSWNDLKNSLTQQGISQNILIDNGLVVPSDKGGYDRFRNRIMFPIENYKNQVIAFGGRVIEKEEPKYLNSPETKLFNKSYNLFGLNKNQEDIRKSNQAFIVEGYMDVIGLYNSGLKTAVAPLGTAITEGQLLLLWKYQSSPIICLDGDVAGQTAAFRAAKRALSILQPGRTLRFMVMPDGEDPDSFVKKYGKEEFLKLAESTFAITECLWQNIVKGKDLKTADDRAVVEQEINELTSVIQNETIARQYKTALRENLWNYGRGIDKNQQIALKNRSRLGTKTARLEAAEKKNHEENLILALTLQYPKQTLCFEEKFAEIVFNDSEHKILQKAILEFLDSSDLDNQEFDDYLRNVSLIELKSRVLKSCEGILQGEQENIQEQGIANYWNDLYNQLQNNKQSSNKKSDKVVAQFLQVASLNSNN